MARIMGSARLMAAALASVGMVALGSAPASAQAPAVQVPPLDYTVRTLENGLTVYALRDPTTPNVAVSLWYDVGSKHDPHQRSGFAHLFEHILSRKTVNMPYNMINGLTEDVGGARNASTGWDRTNYYEIVPAPYLETMLWTHAERMARPVVDPEVFERERNVVKEELRQRVLAPPYGRLFRFVLPENAYDRMPHRRPGIGSIEDLDAATLEDARAFHEAYYGPDTATLIVAGNFDPAQLDAWVDEYFGDIPRRPNPVPLAIEERDAPRTEPRSVTAYAPNVPLPVVATTWQIPPASHPDMAALQVLDAILTRGESSRLHKSLVYDQQLATQASGYLAEVEEGGFYGLYAILAGGKGVDEAEAALAAEVERMRAAPPSAAELTEAKNEIVADALREREIFSNRAFALGEALVSTGNPRHLDERLAAVQQVTAADVQRAARTWLAPQARVDIRYLNEEQRPAGATGEGWANPVPLPEFRTVPAATRPAHQLAAEGQRQAPPAPGPDVPVRTPEIVRTELANGMDLVVARTTDVPVATMAVVIPGGSATDPRTKAGLAQMAADLATKGTATRSAQQIAAEIESLGASLSGGSGADGTYFLVSAPAPNLEAAGRILADVVRNATFPAEELERERKRAIDGLAVQMKDPGAIANMAAGPVLYGAAPYGSQTTPATLAGLTRDDLAAHAERMWDPRNAALVVTGGVDPQAAAAMAGRLFGDWRADGPAPSLPQARAGREQPPRTIVIDLPNAGQAAVLVGVRGVDRADPSYYDLAIANAVLGSGSQGRLFEEIRTKRALSYGAYSAMPARADDALLTAQAQTKNETAPEVVEILLAELDRLGSEPLPAETVEKRKAFLTGSLVRQSESSSGFGATLANLVLQGLPPEEAVRQVEKLRAVEAAGATRAAASTVSADEATVIVVGDSAQFLDRLRAIRPDVEVIPASELDLNSPTLRTPAAIGERG